MANMFKRRALFTWFVFLSFLLLVALRLEFRIEWNWFAVFWPMWIFDIVLCIEALVNVWIACQHNLEFRRYSQRRNQNLAFIGIVFLKVAAQLILCLKLEYPALQLTIHHVLMPLCILLPLVIFDVTKTLFRSDPSN